MKIAITGHTSGIGLELFEVLSNRGNEVLGLSRRNGFNIHDTARLIEQIDPCDVFINNAHSEYAQTKLLLELAKKWTGSNKHIIIISSMITQLIKSPDSDLEHYRIQKLALEEAVKQLRCQDLKLKLTIVRPGNLITTCTDNTVPIVANASEWAKTLIDFFDIAANRNLSINEISLGLQRTEHIFADQNATQ